MKRKHYLIDAFNLINSKVENSRELQKNKGGAVKKLGQEYIDRLKGFVLSSGCEVTMVFDGENIGIGNRGYVPDVVFSGKYVDADIIIKKIVDRTDVKAGLVVVTSDREIVSYARLSGAETLDSFDFQMMLDLSADSDTVNLDFDQESLPSTSEISSDSPHLSQSIAESTSGGISFDTPQPHSTHSSRSSEKKKNQGKSKTGKYKGTEFYGGFSDGLDDDELSDLLSDYDPKLKLSQPKSDDPNTSKRVYHTDFGSQSYDARDSKAQPEVATKHSQAKTVDSLSPNDRKGSVGQTNKSNKVNGKNKSHKSIDLSELGKIVSGKK